MRNEGLRRFLAVVVTVSMVLSSTPTASLAEGLAALGVTSAGQEPVASAADGAGGQAVTSGAASSASAQSGAASQAGQTASSGEAVTSAAPSAESGPAANAAHDADGLQRESGSGDSAQQGGASAGGASSATSASSDASSSDASGEEGASAGSGTNAQTGDGKPDADGAAGASSADVSAQPAEVGQAADGKQNSAAAADQQSDATPVATTAVPAFRQEATVDGTRVTVEADEGAFPEGARLSVKSVSPIRRVQAELAVAEVRPKEQNVAKSLAFDIKVLAADGSELQPAEGHEVKVSFAVEHASDEVFDAQVYHLAPTTEGASASDAAPTGADPAASTGPSGTPAPAPDGSSSSGTTPKLDAQALETTVDEGQELVSAKTDGFSIYVVQLTYGSLSYQMPFGAAVPLAEILEALGLADRGMPSAVSIDPADNPYLYQVRQMNGTWFVVSQANPQEAGEKTGTLILTFSGVELRVELSLKAEQAGAVTIRKEWVDADGYPLEPPADQASVTIKYTVTNPIQEGDDGAAPPAGGAAGDEAPAVGYATSGTLTLTADNDWSAKILVPEPFSGTITLSEEPVVGFKATEWVLNSDNRYVLPFDGGTATLDVAKLYEAVGAYDTANINKLIDDGTAVIAVANKSIAQSVSYVQRWWDGAAVQQQTLTLFSSGGLLHKLDDLAKDASWDGMLQAGHFYYVEGELTISKRLVAGSDAAGSQAHLILCDGAKLMLPAGINVPQGTILNVYGQEGDSGQLIATGGNYQAGIGGNDGIDNNTNTGDITLQGGTITATGGLQAAGIGSGGRAEYSSSKMHVKILGGSVSAKGGDASAGIGGAKNSSISANNFLEDAVAIYGGTVTAEGGSKGAGIGGGMRCAGVPVSIWGGTVTARGGSDETNRMGGAGIGAGAAQDNVGRVSPVTIHGGSIEARGGTFAAGVGGATDIKNPRDKGRGEVVVTISGGTLVAYGGLLGAGVGGGFRGASSEVTISGGTVEAHGGLQAAGIGSGGSAPVPKCAGVVTISGGKVSAFGGDGGAGIGGGLDSDGPYADEKNPGLVVTDGEVLAQGGRNAAGIGGGGDGPDGGIAGGYGGVVLIQGGTIKAYGGSEAAGIGSGIGNPYDRAAMGGITMVQGGSIEAQGGDGGAGIGGGYGANGNKVFVSGGSVRAEGGPGGAGIGGGRNASGGTVNVTGGVVDAGAVFEAAGIGGGTGSLINGGGANVSVTGGLVMANSGGPGQTAIGRGMPGTFLQGDGELFLGDNIGCTFGSRLYQKEGVATRETRVARCRDHSYVRLEGLADSFEVRVKWDGGEEASRPAIVKIRYRLKKEGAVVRTGTLTIPRAADGSYTGRVYVEPGVADAIEIEEEAIPGYRVGSWDFGDSGKTPYDIKGNAGVENYPAYGIEIKDAGGVPAATSIRNGSGVVTVTNRPFLALVVRKAWPQGATLPEDAEVRIAYTLSKGSDASAAPKTGTLTLKADQNAANPNDSWIGAIDLSDGSGTTTGRYDVIEFSETSAPADFAPESWVADFQDAQGPFALELTYPEVGNRAKAKLDASSGAGSLFGEPKVRDRFWQAVGTGAATVTLTNGTATTYRVEKRWVLDSRAGQLSPSELQVQLQRRSVDAQGNAVWKPVETVTLTTPTGDADPNVWTASFKPVSGAEDAEYRIRELDKDGKTVYAAGDEDAPEDWDGYAKFLVGSGQTEASYGATYAYGRDAEGNDVPTTTVITNSSPRAFHVQKAWELGTHTSEKPESVTVVLQRWDGEAASGGQSAKGAWNEVERVTLSEANGWKADFKPVASYQAKGDASQGGQAYYMFLYRVRELDREGKVVLAESDGTGDASNPAASKARTADAGKPVATFVTGAGAGDGQGSHEAAYIASYGFAKKAGSGDQSGTQVDDEDSIIITNELAKRFSVEKTWDIDLAGKDHPEEVKVQLQRKVEEGEQGYDADKTQWVDVAGTDGSPVTLTLKGEGTTWEGSFAPVALLRQKQGDQPRQDYTFRVRELDESGSVVHAKADADNPKDGEGQDAKPQEPTVVYTVKESAAPGAEGASGSGDSSQQEAKTHKTKYYVTYADGDTTKITNLAVMDVSMYKRWFMLGTAKAPESVYLMLMGRVKQSQGQGGAGQAAGSAAGSTGQQKIPYLPVYNAIYGDALTASGITDILGLKDTLLKVPGGEITEDKINNTVKFGLAIAKAYQEADKNSSKRAWNVRFGVRKYDQMTKMEMEYLGTELVTGLMKIGTDMLTGFDFPVMIQPLSPRYLTVFGKAYNIFADYELTSNVINTWLGWDSDIENGIGGTKNWKGDSEDERPTEVKLHAYYQDGGQKKEVTGSPVTVKASDNWAWMLPLKKDDPAVGKTITIEEEVPAGYTASYSGYDVTNTKTSNAPETVNVSGSKTWDDESNVDGSRPSSITIRLFADGTEKDSRTVMAANGWKWTFANLPKYQSDGTTAISYTIKEDSVSGYETTVDGYNVTNRHTPGKKKESDPDPAKTAVKVAKVWNDDNNRDGLRPSSVTVHLLANGLATDKTLELSKTGDWSGSFTSLPKTLGGTDIVYTVTEDAVANYETTISGSASEGFIITNTHTPGKRSISVAKKWEDEENRDGLRPSSVTVRLLAEGVDTGKSLTLQQASDGSWPAGVFTDVPTHRGDAEIEYRVVEETVDGYTSEVTGSTASGFTITNTHTPQTVDIPVKKVWDDADDQDGKRPESVTLRLRKVGSSTDIATLTLSESNSWSGSFAGQPRFEGGQPISYSVVEDAVSGYSTTITGDAHEGFTVTNTHAPETTTVEVRKTWDDEGNQARKRPASVTVRLRSGGLVVRTQRLTAANKQDDDNTWAYTWTGLPKYQYGQEIAYSVTEDAVSGYQTEYPASGTSGGHLVLNIKNSYTAQVDKTSVTVAKTWDDSGDADGIRPRSVKVTLYRQVGSGAKEEAGTAKLSLSSGWMHTFADLDAKSGDSPITYTVEEEKTSVITGTDGKGTYATQVTGDASQGFTITNTHTPRPTRTVSVTKVWDDANDQDGIRPGRITLTLKHGDTELAKQNFAIDASKGEQSFEFKGVELPEGEQLTAYAVVEDAISGYSARVTGNVSSGFTVTNTHKPESRKIAVKKVWADANDQDGLRPKTVTVHLLAGGEDSGQVLTLSAHNGWTGSFTAPQNKGGKPISYGIAEDAVEGYTTAIAGSADAGFTITNTHEPQTIKVAGKKTWVGDESLAGLRPDTITVRLRANGRVKDTKQVGAADGWAWSWQDLPVYDKGKPIDYDVTEDLVDDYTASYQDGEIRNTLQRGKTQVSFVRAWDDANDQDGIRPTSVKVILKANGKPVSGPKGFMVLSDHDNDVYSFTGLAARDATGRPIVYTVEEERTSVLTGTDGPGTYAVAVEGNAREGFLILNTHTPETREISGKKTWIDNDDDQHVRPDTITVSLRADGGLVDTREVSAADGWAWSWQDLPVYENGQKISYAVTESEVPNYARFYRDYDVINLYGQDSAQLDVQLVWDDFDDADGSRPTQDRSPQEYVTLVLLANGEPVQLEEAGLTYALRLQMGADGRYHVMPLTADEGSRYHELTREELTEGVYAYRYGDYSGVILGSEDSGVFSFAGLPRTDRYGNEIVYSVDERRTDILTGDDGPGTYGILTLGNMDDGYAVINYHTPEVVSVSGTKTWDDGDRAELRPESITVRLHADGEIVDIAEVVPDADGAWSWRFDGLPRYEGKHEIAYVVTEDAIHDYEPSYGDAASEASGGVTDGAGLVRDITNRYVPGYTSVSVAKVWDDASNAAGIRPERVSVQLLADGEPTSWSPLELSAENSWVDTFYGLPRYNEAGKEIAYTVAEEPVAGYAASVAGDAVQGFVVTNRLDQAADYQVHYFYEKGGAYADTPDASTMRQGAVLSEVGVTNADKAPDPAHGQPADGRYVLDERGAQVYEGVVAADGSLTLKVYFRQVFLISYDLNGGVLKGSTADVVEEHFFGDEIRILEAPTRTGHSFDYWQGSVYHPGDSYRVTGDHRFVAQWKQGVVPSTPPRPHLPNTADRTGSAWPLALLLAGMAAVSIGLRRRRAARTR